MSTPPYKKIEPQEKIGNEPVGGIRENRDFLLKLLAGAIAPFGSILTAPQITTLLTSSDKISWKLLIIGSALMMVSLIMIPIILWRMDKNLIEKGTTGKFTQRMDECIRAMVEYSDSERTDTNKKNMIQKITTEAIAVIGHDARICIYRRALRDTKNEEEACFELEEETRGDRNPQSQARAEIRSNNEAGETFINAIEELGQLVIVQNIEKYTPGMILNPNPANGYKSFILSPIKARIRNNGRQPTIGALTVDFPRKDIITKEMVAVITAFTEMFAVVYQQANDQPFPVSNTQPQPTSPLHGIIVKGDNHHD